MSAKDLAIQEPDNSNAPQTIFQASRNKIGDMQRLYDELSLELQFLAGSDASKQAVPDLTSLPTFQKRLFIRSLASFIEALANALKAAALSGWRSDTLSPETCVLAADQSINLNEQGLPQIGIAKIPTIRNVLFAFHVFAEANGTKFDLDTSNSEWANFKKFIAFRDRMTHPKRPDDIAVSDEELTITIGVLLWFQQTFTKLVDAAISSLKTHLEETGAMRNRSIQGMGQRTL